MASIYSVLLFEGHNIGSPVEVFVDTAFIYILRDIDVFFPGADVQATLSVISEPVGGTIFQTAQPIVNNPGYWSQWRGRQVIVPQETGHILTITCSAEFNAPDVRISGYQLTPP